MFKNYLKITLRSFFRNRLYASINLLGLSVGIAAFILIYLFVQQQLSYDTHYQGANRIYRVINHVHMQEQTDVTEWTSRVLVNRLQNDFPEVEKAGSFFNESGLLIYQNKRLRQKSLGYADQDFLDIFKFSFLSGDPKSALVTSNAIVLTRSTAQKLFGRYEKALNKSLEMSDGAKYRVSGVIEDLPVNTHLKFGSLISVATLKGDYLKGWGYNGFNTYIKLKQNTQSSEVTQKLKGLTQTLLKDKLFTEKYYKSYALQPLTDIHLYPYAPAVESNIKYVYIFSAIGIFILLIACINYMNMATSGAMNRAREVGIRKVVGSHRKQLIVQFMFESLCMVSLAALIGLAVVELALPWFNRLTTLDLSLPLDQIQTWLALATLVAGVSFLSGIYPAFFLSAFNTIKVLKGKFSRNRQTVHLRRGLVVFQFTLSIIVLVSTWISFEQFQFMQQKDLGFSKEQVYVLPLENPEAAKKLSALKDALAKNPRVQQIALASSTPGEQTWGNNLFQYQEKGEKKSIAADFFQVEKNYFDLMKIKLLRGEVFTPMSTKDSSYSVVVNEAFVKQVGWNLQALEGDKNPIGKKINRRLKIVGVVKNLHIRSLHNKIEPLLMLVLPKMRRGEYLYARLHPKDLDNTLAGIRKSYDKVESKYPFNGFFLDQHFAKEYQKDRVTLKVFSTLSGLAVLIACLGLFALAAFTISQRTKEIGIRKVLGASIKHILRLVTQDFVFLIALALVIAIPLVVYLGNQWLTQFAYQAAINYWGIFGVAAVLVMFITFLTVSIHALRAVRVNPTEVLKDE
ncbi:MAG TPA: hypothetical protein DCS93_37615 [Microscillaceae bacterium]|nr:hypothetical protein [Microscillaceae bacterium]